MVDCSRLTVLVTGGSGFVGKAVVAELLLRGHRVVATATGSHEVLPATPALQWTAWDATRDSLPLVNYSGLDAIIHLAAPSDLFRFPEQAPATFEVTVAATFRLLEAARSSGHQTAAVCFHGRRARTERRFGPRGRHRLPAEQLLRSG